MFFFFFSSRRRHTRFKCDWSSDVRSSDLSRLSSRSCQRNGRVAWFKPGGHSFENVFRKQGNRVEWNARRVFDGIHDRRGGAIPGKFSHALRAPSPLLPSNLSQQNPHCSETPPPPPHPIPTPPLSQPILS